MTEPETHDLPPCERPNHDVLIAQHGHCRFCSDIRKRITDRRDAEDRRDEGIERAAHEHDDTVVGDEGRVSIGLTIRAAIEQYLIEHSTLHVDDLWDWAEQHHDGWRSLHIAPGRYIGAQLQWVQKANQMCKIPITGHDGCFVAKPSHRSNMAPKWMFSSIVYQGANDQ